MRGWLALSIAVLVSGCSSAGQDETTPDGVTVVTDPRDTAYLSNATAGSHVHDYWDGRDRAPVLDQQSNDFTVQYSGDRAPVQTFRPADGDIVPQGTAFVEGTLSWTEDDTPDPLFPPAFTHIELWVKTSQDAEARFAANMTNGGAFRFATTNEQDDPPHYVLSLREFVAMARNPGAEETRFSGSFHLTAEAVRGHPLVVFPPHPDPWQGRTELPLNAFDMNVDAHVSAVVTAFCMGGCANVRFGPYDNVTVPFDASVVEVQVRAGPGSAPIGFTLQAHGADARSWHAVPAASSTSASWTFRMEVGPGQGDSPYASQSLWEFWVQMDTPEGQGAWKGAFNVTATALR